MDAGDRLDSNRNVLAGLRLSLDTTELEAGLKATRRRWSHHSRRTRRLVAEARRAGERPHRPPIGSRHGVRRDRAITDPRRPGRRAIAAEPSDESAGPAITGSQLEDLGLGRSMVEGIEGLAKVLDIEKLETLGDPGILLMIDDANERFTDRGRVNSLVDSLMGTLETADSLTTAMPWTLERARLSDPTAPRLRGLFPIPGRRRRIITPPFTAWDAARLDPPMARRDRHARGSQQISSEPAR